MENTVVGQFETHPPQRLKVLPLSPQFACWQIVPKDSTLKRIIGQLNTGVNGRMDKEIVLIEWLDSKGLERWEYLDVIEPLPKIQGGLF